jgi:succinoglycan biosynthesis protein ExoO
MEMRPDISFIMAAHNAIPYIEEAIASVLAQTKVKLELIITDDASTDGTSEYLAQLSDARLTKLKSDIASGPSTARNKAMARARGQWIAIVDADDVLHPDRSRKLLDVAAAENADIVADEITAFDERATPEFCASTDPSQTISLTKWIKSNGSLGGKRNLGYVKPIIRSEFMRSRNIWYDDRIRVGEDYLLVLALLAGGANFVLSRHQLYGYRLRTASLSKSLDNNQIELLVASQSDLLRPLVERDASMQHLVEQYEKEARALASYQKLKRFLASSDWQSAIRLVKAKPIVMAALARLAMNRLSNRIEY